MNVSQRQTVGPALYCGNLVWSHYENSLPDRQLANDRSYVTRKTSRIAVISGWLWRRNFSVRCPIRHASSCATHYAPVVGNISMDLTTIGRVLPFPAVEVGG